MGMLDFLFAQPASAQGDYGPGDAPNTPGGMLGGLMPWMQDPRNQAGLAAFGRALAQAGAPRKGPLTWGGGLSDAFAGMTEGRQAYDARQLQKMLHTAQLGKANEEVRGKKRINDMIEKAMSGGMVGGNAPTLSASGDYGPGEAPNIPQPAAYGANPFGLEYAMALGKDDITNAIKAKELGMTGVSRDPNKQYNGPQGWYTPTDAKTGLGLDPQGRSTLAPGFQQNIAALEAAKTGATEQAKADVASNVPQVFQGFGPGGAPVLATPRELRGGHPAQQDPNRPSPIPGLTERIQSELANNGIQFAADSDGNFKIVGIEPKKQNAAPTRAGAMVFGSNPSADAASKARAVAEAELPPKSIELSNKTFMDGDYKAAIEKGQTASQAISQAKIARGALENLGGTNWATPAKVAGAKVLNVIGIPNAEKIASNAELFKSTLYNHVLSRQLDQKGPQTESDAQRIQQTYAQLGNTTRANNFLIDTIEAQAELDKRRETFYRNAMPIAQKDGNLAKIGQEWLVREPSIFDMPSMAKWKK